MMPPWVFTSHVGENVVVTIRTSQERTDEFQGTVVSVSDDNVVRLFEDQENTHFILLPTVVSVTVTEE